LQKISLFSQKEVADIKEKIKKLEREMEFSYPVDSWARQEIKLIKERIESIPPPLEDAPYDYNHTGANCIAEMQGMPGMQVLPS
jgi:hypothetical protein